MSINVNPYGSETQASFLARSKKAIAGAISGGVAALGSAFLTAAADGVIDQLDIWPSIGVTVAGLVLGFATVWGAPANANNGQKV